MIEAYVNGQFTNLTSGTVYRNYDRVKNGSAETIKEKEPLYIGMDFNVEHMAAVVCVKRANKYHAVGELKEIFDTPDMIKIIQEKYPAHLIKVYPDASGKNRKSNNASESDIVLLRAARFQILNFNANPLVKNRVLAVNKAFEDDKIAVNCVLCPTVAECLEQQNYDSNGEPDKKSGFDHMNDAFGYFTAYEMPIKQRAKTTSSSW